MAGKVRREASDGPPPSGPPAAFDVIGGCAGQLKIESTGGGSGGGFPASGVGVGTGLSVGWFLLFADMAVSF